jgi:N-acetylglucosamine-6-phosphate deacetylase
VTNATGYFDLQVNGYAGLDFNGDDYTPDQLRGVCDRLNADGVTCVLATVITAPLGDMLKRIQRIAELIDQDAAVAEMIAGIHVEGPFISRQPGYVGAHPPNAVRDADLDVAKQLVESGRGHVKLLTLAPEMDPQSRVTRWLVDHRVVVAAGHSDASLDCLKSAIDAGLALFTHLGNGCPAALPRHDNIIQRVLFLADRLCISFIADGHHVPALALKNYLSLVPPENIMIVTDAISAAGLGPGKYPLGTQWVEVDEAGAAWSADRTHFAGSAATMPSMVRVLQSIGISDDQIRRWVSENPQRLLDGSRP